MAYPLLRVQSGNRVTMDHAISLITSSKWKPRHHGPIPYPLLRIKNVKRVAMVLCHIPYDEFKVKTASPLTHVIYHHLLMPYPLLNNEIKSLAYSSQGNHTLQFDI